MRVFVYEYTCATASGTGRHDSLRSEGRAMLAALAEDLAALPGVEVFALLATGASLHLSCVECRHVTAAEEQAIFRELAKQCDGSIVIAPEFDDILAQRCRRVTDYGGRLLGSDADTVRLAA